MKKLLLPLLIAATVGAATAQPLFSGGFRAGLTFSTLSGPSETNDEGQDLETFSLSSGFHVGATFNLRLTDVFGVRGELLYAQKGVNYVYDGTSFWVFEPVVGPSIYSIGTRRTNLDLTNSYLELPLMAFGRFGPIEVSGGFNTSILIGSRGFGETTYSGRSTLGTTIAPFTVNLEHRYNADTYREKIATEFESRVIEGRPVEIPLTIGAYYDAVDNGQKAYKFLDLGLVGGVSFYLNKSLFLGGRLHYGLLDVTNNQQDVSKKALDVNRTFVLRSDEDRNLMLYLSLGFSL